MTPPASPHTPPDWHHVTLTEDAPERFTLRFAVSHVAVDAGVARMAKVPDYIEAGLTLDAAKASGRAVEAWLERQGL